MCQWDQTIFFIRFPCAPADSPRWRNQDSPRVRRAENQRQVRYQIFAARSQQPGYNFKRFDRFSCIIYLLAAIHYDDPLIRFAIIERCAAFRLCGLNRGTINVAGRRDVKGNST